MAGSTTPPAPAADAAASAAEAARAREAELKRLDDARLARQAARDAALAHALEAEQEAAAATTERDAAAARVRDALARAASARAAAAAAEELEGPPVNDDDDGASIASHQTAHVPDVHAAMLLHEAAAVLNLHTQAAGIQNIRSLIPTVLDATSGPYTRWREQFLLTVGRFSLQDHVLRDAPPVDSPDWARMDCVVRSWLDGTIAPDLAEIVMGRGGSARAAWLAIEDQFLGNRETRTLHLDA